MLYRHTNKAAPAQGVTHDPDVRRLDADLRRRLHDRLARKGLSEAEIDRQVENLMTRDIPFRLDVSAALNAKD